MEASKLGQRALAIELRKRGVPVRKIWKDYHIPTSFTKRWYRRYRHGQALEDRRRAGRPQTAGKVVRKRICALLKSKKRNSTRFIAARIKHEFGVPISHQTISREAVRLGLRVRIRRKKPLLTEAHKRARVAFAQKKRPRGFFDRVFTTDEKTFTICRDTRGAWVEVGEDPPPRQTLKYQTTVKVWGGVGVRGLTPLFRVPSSQKGPEYRDFLRDKVFPEMKDRYGSDWIFQQDGDGTHTARVVTDWLNSQDIEWIDDWPSRSPDLSPIENLWSILAQRLAFRMHRSEEGLWRSLQEEWAKIDTELSAKLGRSFEKRLRQVIEKNGEPLRY